MFYKIQGKFEAKTLKLMILELKLISKIENDQEGAISKLVNAKIVINNKNFLKGTFYKLNIEKEQNLAIDKSLL